MPSVGTKIRWQIASLIVLVLFTLPLYAAEAADASLQTDYESAVQTFQTSHQASIAKQKELTAMRKQFFLAAQKKNNAASDFTSLKMRLARQNQILGSMNARVKSLQSRGWVEQSLKLSQRRAMVLDDMADLQQRYDQAKLSLPAVNADYKKVKADYLGLMRNLDVLKTNEESERVRMAVLQRKIKIGIIKEKMAARAALNKTQSGFKGSAPSATNTSVDQYKIPLDLGDTSIQQKIVDGFSRDDFSTTAAFDWPIQPTKGISAHFHDENYIKTFGVDHYAIDIVAIQGTEIVAPADAYVLQAEDGGDTGFSYILLLHSDGYLTLYGHVSRIDVTIGDKVRRGSIVGLSGGTPGTSGAGSKTTGPHLHFEVWKDGERVDPMLYLPKQ